MNNLPPEYRNEITINSKISSITGLKDKKYKTSEDIAEEIQTIQDLFIKRYQLPKWMKRESRYNVIADIMNSDISIDDISDKHIKTEEEFRLCLFALISNSDVICKDGNRHSIKELWGSDIVNVDYYNQILINKNPYFATEYSGINKKGESVNNLILFEYDKSKKISIYLFTNADKEIIDNAYFDGFPEDNYRISSFNTKYIDIVCSVLDIDSIKNNMDLFYVTKKGLLIIKSRNLDLTGIVAPREISNIDKPWRDFKTNKNYQLLTNN